MSRSTPGGKRRIVWPSVLTVISAAILIGAEVFGAAFAGGWAVEEMTGLGSFIVGILRALRLFPVVTGHESLAGVILLQFLFILCGIAVMVAFIRNASRVEPFTSRG